MRDILAKVSMGLTVLATSLMASPPAQAYSGPAFVRRTAAIAQLADTAYCHDAAGAQVVDGKTFEYESQWSTPEVRVYLREKDGKENLIVNFCGTRTSSPRGIGDMLRNLQGATINAPASNAWTGEEYSSLGVGLGFQARVYNYMNGDAGKALEAHYLARRTVDAKTESLITGHSLGGASSQIFSYYLSRYLRERGFSAERFPVYNFAFNPPQSVSRGFHAAMVKETDLGLFTTFNFSVRRDAISTWASPYMHGAVDQPNRLGTFPDEFDYLAHAELEPVIDEPARIENHRLTGEVIERWSTACRWKPQVPALMGSRYHPSW